MYTINNMHVIVGAWSNVFKFYEVLSIIPLWVTLPNLPLSCWGKKSLSSIGSTLGTFLFADNYTTIKVHKSYARLLVEINITRLLPKTIQIQDPSGEIFEH